MAGRAGPPPPPPRWTTTDDHGHVVTVEVAGGEVRLTVETSGLTWRTSDPDSIESLRMKLGAAAATIKDAQTRRGGHR